jgi:hypothetical protein
VGCACRVACSAGELRVGALQQRLVVLDFAPLLLEVAFDAGALLARLAELAAQARQRLLPFGVLGAVGVQRGFGVAQARLCLLQVGAGALQLRLEAQQAVALVGIRAACDGAAELHDRAVQRSDSRERARRALPTQLAHEARRCLQRVHHQHAPQQVAHSRLEARVVPHEVGGDAQHARLARDSVARRVSGLHQVQRQEGQSPCALGA